MGNQIFFPSNNQHELSTINTPINWYQQLERRSVKNSLVLKSLMQTAFTKNDTITIAYDYSSQKNSAFLKPVTQSSKQGLTWPFCARQYFFGEPISDQILWIKTRLGPENHWVHRNFFPKVNPAFSTSTTDVFFQKGANRRSHTYQKLLWVNLMHFVF